MNTVPMQLDEFDILTTRETGLSLRVAIEHALQIAADEAVVLDFSGVRNATQSCIDEIVGVLVQREGPRILPRLVFKGCSPAVQSLIQFVVADRLESRAQMKT